MRLFTLDGIIDTYAKLNQRGLSFIASKFNLNEVTRAKIAFKHIEIQSSNWWIIPNELFEFEDSFLKNNKSYFVFGIYKK